MPDGSQSEIGSINPKDIKRDEIQFADGSLAIRVIGGKDAPPYDLNSERTLIILIPA